MMFCVLRPHVMCLLRASFGEVRRRAVPVPMSIRGTYSSSSPTRHDLYFHNSKLKTGHQAPTDSPQNKPASSGNTATSADALSASHSDNTAGLRPGNGAAASSHSSVTPSSWRPQLLSRTNGASSIDAPNTRQAWPPNGVDGGVQQVYSNAEPALTATQDSSHSSSHSNGNIRDPKLPPDPAQAASVHATREPSTAAPSRVFPVRQPQSPRETQPGAALHESYAPRPAQHGEMSKEVILSDEVKDFLSQPVSGPFRPIIFDLETTGSEIPECPLCCLQTLSCSIFCLSIQVAVFGTCLWFHRPARNPVRLSSSHV